MAVPHTHMNDEANEIKNLNTKTHRHTHYIDDLDRERLCVIVLRNEIVHRNYMLCWRMLKYWRPRRNEQPN